MKNKCQKLILIFALSVLPHLSLHATADFYALSAPASVYRFQKAMANRGHAESQFKLGLMFETGTGVDQGLVNAILWYKKAADQNYKPAINRLIYLDIKETGFKDSHQKWLRNLKQDAQFNEGEALFLLGQMYAEGTGIPKDLNRALKLLRKASRSDIPGSVAEIKRFELEAAKANKTNNNTNIATLALNPVNSSAKPIRSIAVVPPLSPALPRTRPFITLEQLREQQARGKQIRLNKQAQTKIKKPAMEAEKAPLIQATKKIPKEVNQPEKALQMVKKIEDVETHPMDIICTGLNMRLSGCR